ncbi:succinyldiaminopimelate transaminase [Plantactinospora sp. KLBMP9567]|uniref:succinyldiaminopimelate transaminase n=1 Tax=Plantactinospora sp. KLBMP9567 TaxID=3085900 RepID=UPI002982125F|nr:succinyldiaminopimelate transaminase [Plantactinospora sp. KLBMP9567]MDW5326252.1 succinyldiaminopimelate transaminase [Plantactinospora sp. KLBMP9567]MDW5330824.1 succinyldiaminopimelate transaminase [Plantactinospora sp. KLBMP9567]
MPDFPWDLLEPAKALAGRHPDGIVDLSVGTPVDPVPGAIRAALAAASDAPGYPLTAGSPALRAALAEWVARSCGAAPEMVGVLPTIGSKELVGWLPTLLGLGPGDVVVIPRVCYPTYEVGARLAGAEVVRADALTALGPDPRVRLLWVNSPSNPTGRVLPPEHLRKVVDWARERGVVVASDECYLSLGWEETPTSILDPAVSGGDHTNLLAVHSLSKRSNLAGYRAGFVAGDRSIVGTLLAVRKHAGMIVPAPVQAAMVAALGDEAHVVEQRIRYSARREVLRDALVKAGFEITYSTAGLYLWASRGEDCWATVDWLARRGILVAPGEFYGPTGNRHVRVALTATDERVAAAADRLLS